MAEMTIQRQDFDGPWKEALDTYFPEFMQFFFPEIHAAVDWAQGYSFLDKEFQKIVREAEQGRRHADKLVRVRIGGEETWLLIHVEIQGQAESGFPKRMFVYYYRIVDRYAKETVSLAVLSDPDPGFRPCEYVRERFGCRNVFTFPTAKVLDYAADWTALEESDNLFAVVVMAHLKAQETASGRTEERKRWKLRLIRLLYARGYGRKDVLELFRFIDWLLILPPELERSFAEELNRIEKEKGVEYITSVERIGMERGLEQGVKQGSLNQARIMLLEVLSVRFGLLSHELTERIEQITDHEVLQNLHRTAIASPDPQTFAAQLEKTGIPNRAVSGRS